MDNQDNGKEVARTLKSLLDNTTDEQYAHFNEFLTALAVSYTDRDLAYVAKIVSSVRDMMTDMKEVYDRLS